MSFKPSSILILGGYGAVGRSVCEELSKSFTGQIIVAGRNLQRAQSVAQQFDNQVEALYINASNPTAYQKLWDQTTVVINCVEHNNVEVARECIRHSAHYIDVSATIEILEGLQTLQSLAKQSQVNAILSVGVAPGLTNLLTQYAQAQLGPLTYADLFILLGIGEPHGEAAIRWTLQNLHQPFSIESYGHVRSVKPFGEGRITQLPAPFGKRIAYRFNFSDQHTIPKTLDIPAVNTWLYFDSHLATQLMHILAWSGLTSLLPLDALAQIIAGFSKWQLWGVDDFLIQVQAAGVNGKEGSFALAGIGEAKMTGFVAAWVAKYLVSTPVVPGVLHIEQLLSLEKLLAIAQQKLQLYEHLS